ncbi:uncharacterized protein LOC6574740 isoform X1 [Drosophila mojavensis]|uniref:Uncharacterized protein, isoform A n=1 Tax=Drosophila mojavensis TaxID=7230 RepID=B4K5Z4_DROMO|nr:uncharacterized protein LOC6574740 isoform X1 [Drosophila mojavensis]EDW16231.1 uncharacterized protein Dmoj_GI22339, isoform A [Drosophila mojavensis]
MVGRNAKALSHFHRLTEYIVQCKHCDKTLSSKHTSSNLTRHLIRNHKLLARAIFAGDEGKMLAELREELNAPDPEPEVHMDANLGERETKTAVRTIIDNQNQARQEQQQTERNKVIGKNNKLWAHFVRISEFMAKCKHCSKTLSSKHSSSNLMRHIIRRHHNLSKNLSYSQHSLISPKKELMQPEDRRQGDPLEKVDFDDVDSIIEKVTDHMDDEFTSVSLQEPFYEYVVDNSDVMVSRHCEDDPSNMAHSMEHPGDSNSMGEATTQLDEKLKAETIYYNEMAELARAKRRLIDLQTKKLLMDMDVVESN